VFGFDEAAYSRELAPLAGHYPVLLLGAPWWFFDSPLGMRRYLDAVMETAGLYKRRVSTTTPVRSPALPPVTTYGGA